MIFWFVSSVPLNLNRDCVDVPPPDGVKVNNPLLYAFKAARLALSTAADGNAAPYRVEVM